MKYQATIKGTLEFERTITVYATNIEDAKIVARELTEKGIADGDTLKINDVQIDLPKFDVDIVYAVSAKEGE